MIRVVHTADSHCDTWNEEQDCYDITQHISWNEDIDDAGTETDKPIEEHEIPELATGGYALNIQRLAKSCNIDIKEVLHLKILLVLTRVLSEESQNLFCVV